MLSARALVFSLVALAAIARAVMACSSQTSGAIADASASTDSGAGLDASDGAAADGSGDVARGDLRSCPSGCDAIDALQSSCDDCSSQPSSTCNARYPGARLRACLCAADAGWQACVGIGVSADAGYAGCCP